MYHVVALLLCLAAGVWLMITINSDKHYVTNYEAKTAAAVSSIHALQNTRIFSLFLGGALV